MAKPKYIDLLLTCEDQTEARKIANVLLEKRLIACAKFVPIDCVYWWEGKVTDAKEILLIMESRADLFDTIEAAVAKLHSYDTFVLQSIPFGSVSSKASAWLDKELNTGDNE